MLLHFNERIYLQKQNQTQGSACSRGKYPTRLFPLQCFFLSTFSYMLNIKVGVQAHPLLRGNLRAKPTTSCAFRNEVAWSAQNRPCRKGCIIPKLLYLVSAPAVPRQALSLSPLSPRDFVSAQTSPMTLDAFMSQVHAGLR